MKKQILIFFLVSSLFVSAQDKSMNDDSGLKKMMLEVEFTPWGDDNTPGFESIQFKHLLERNRFFRLGLIFDYKYNSRTEDDFDDTDSDITTFSESSFMFGIKPGIEFRLFPGHKISPYYGFEAVYKNKFSSSEYTEDGNNIYDDYSIDISGSWMDSQISYNGYGYTIFTQYTELGYQSIGADLFVGADYNFFKGMYLGVEFGFGGEYKKYKQVVISSDGDDITLPSSREINFGLYYNNSIRLGIMF